MKQLNFFVFVLFLSMISVTGAYAACCTGHGGVASCDKTTGIKMCKDGTASPTCTCPKAKAAVKKSTSKAKAIKVDSTKSQKAATSKKDTTTKATTKSKSDWWWGKSKSTTESKSTGGKSAKGCCSRHGGVAQCDKSSGRQKCNDGTLSSSCTCH